VLRGGIDGSFLFQKDELDAETGFRHNGPLYSGQGNRIKKLRLCLKTEVAADVLVG
jgi:hypothetical protein